MEGELVYRPIEAGSIDGTDVVPHDHAIVRAMNANCMIHTIITTCFTKLFDNKRNSLDNPKDDKKIKGRPECTIFVGRLNKITTEKDLEKFFEQFGKIYYIRIVRDIITGLSRGYGFVEFKHSGDCRKALKVRNLDYNN